MEIPNLVNEEELKMNFQPATTLCRCCLTTKRRVLDATNYEAYFVDLTGMNVSGSDGLPHWICYECCMLLIKAVRFKHKVMRAHNILYEYLTRCAPFPIDAEDPELVRYATPQLCSSTTLTVDTSKSKMGFHKILQHEKQINKSMLDIVEYSVSLQKIEGPVKEEHSFSDFEDNLTLQEFRSTLNKITDDDLSNAFEDNENVEVKVEPKVKKKKKKEVKVKTKIIDEEHILDDSKTIRKPLELDPNKIRVVILNPEEQIKQREEESKASLKFPFQCKLCFKGFNFESKLENHMNKHRPARGPFECKLCYMYLPSSYSYSVHSLIHTRRYECVKCGRRMTDRASIYHHYRTQHEGVMTLITCQLCGKVSSNSKTHRGHMRNHHSGDRPKCDQCGKTFVNKDSLAEHQQIHQGIKNYECPTCNKRFRTRTQIKYHQLKHTDVKDYYCVECDVRFKSAHNLRQHLQKSLKHKDKQSLKYACTRCDKRYDRESTLAAHVRVQHDGVRAHVCAACGAALASRNSLAKHVLTVHAGRRPQARHVCDTCGKAFRGKSVLVNHVRTHTGEKPFECSECGRKFTQRTAMRTHVKLVHLKIRRTAKIKPEVPPEVRQPKIDNMFPKDEPPLVFESWNRDPPCDVFYVPTGH